VSRCIPRLARFEILIFWEILASAEAAIVILRVEKCPRKRSWPFTVAGKPGARLNAQSFLTLRTNKKTVSADAGLKLLEARPYRYRSFTGCGARRRATNHGTWAIANSRRGRAALPAPIAIGLIG
jgi:hypothetical protein